MEAKSIRERARELYNARAIEELAAQRMRDEAVREVTEAIKAAFEKEFEEYLPMLIADDISWTAKVNDPRYPKPHGGYIEFSRIQKSVLVGVEDGFIKVMMDMSKDGTYRYEHHFSKTGESYPRMTYGRWDKNEFVSWIAYNLHLLEDDEDTLFVIKNTDEA